MKQVVVQILHSHCYTVGGTPFWSVDKTEPSTELYNVPYTTYGVISASDVGQRMLPVYEMYSISDQNSAVTLLINRTPSVKQEVSLHSNKNPLSLKQTERDSFPSLLDSSVSTG